MPAVHDTVVNLTSETRLKGDHLLNIGLPLIVDECCKFSQNATIGSDFHQMCRVEVSSETLALLIGLLIDELCEQLRFLWQDEYGVRNVELILLRKLRCFG
jgi:hypothetical protein